MRRRRERASEEKSDRMTGGYQQRATGIHRARSACLAGITAVTFTFTFTTPRSPIRFLLSTPPAQSGSSTCTILLFLANVPHNELSPAMAEKSHLFHDDNLDSVVRPLSHRWSNWTKEMTRKSLIRPSCGIRKMGCCRTFIYTYIRVDRKFPALLPTPANAKGERLRRESQRPWVESNVRAGKNFRATLFESSFSSDIPHFGETGIIPVSPFCFSLFWMFSRIMQYWICISVASAILISIFVYLIWIDSRMYAKCVHKSINISLLESYERKKIIENRYFFCEKQYIIN